MPKPRANGQARIRTRSSRTENEVFSVSVERLEAQLEQVLEEDGRTISWAATASIRSSRRTRRNLPVHQVVEDLSSQRSERVDRPASPVEDVRSREMDIALVQRTLSQKRSTDPVPVPVRFSPHEASAYVLQIDPLARPIVEEARVRTDATMDAWVAPYEQPPDLDALAEEARDLWVDHVDARWSTEQFTHPQGVAPLRVRHSWWSKVCAPFVRWEIEGTEEDPSEEIVRRIWQEQFTSEEPDRAYQASYGFFGRTRRFATRFWFGDVSLLEEALEVPEDDVLLSERDSVVEELAIVSQPTQPEEIVLVPRLHVLRAMGGFVGLLALITVPALGVHLARSVKTSIVAVREESQHALTSAAQAAESGSSQEGWIQAANGFARAEQALYRANALALGLAQALPEVRRSYRSAESLLLAGQKAVEAGRLISQGVSRITEPGAALHADERLISFSAYVEQALPVLSEAERLVNDVDPDSLPDDHARAQIDELHAVLSQGRVALSDLRTLTTFMIAIVGHDAPRTYLLAFQNPAELRPSGGFMGSVAEIDVDRGELRRIHVLPGGPYDLRDQLLVRSAPPQPLQLIADRWEFQDANWFPDFLASATKIRWFWSKSGQPTLDGVVAVNAAMVERLLRVTGPIELPEYGKVITSRNVLFELQKSVELEYDREERAPKKIVGALLAELLERLQRLPKSSWIDVARAVTEGLETKDIQIALFRDDEQSLVESYGWAGRVKPTDGDALAIIEANVAGQKTDTSISEKVHHLVEVGNDGSVIDTVKLVRTHEALRGELFKGVNNVSYVRFYVPEGSTLLSADGFSPPNPALFDHSTDPSDEDLDRLVVPEPTITQESGSLGLDVTREFGRTAFGGWVQVEPGHTVETTIRYRLPFTLSRGSRVASAQEGTGLFESASARTRIPYTLLLTSQSGKTNRSIETRLSLPPGWSVDWSTEAITEDRVISHDWDRDRVFAALLQPSHETP